jgi:ubiquinone/menaquinone biosynthesis C-methylase UbiE
LKIADLQSQEMNDEDGYLATGFRHVNGANIDKMMRCLDGLQSMECFRHYKNRSLDLLHGSEGLGALDVASGLGDDVVKLKSRFGRAVGIDASSELVAEAMRRHRGEGCEFYCADATALPFTDEEFGAARVDRSLQHIDNPGKVIKEMVRVVRKGGTLLCAEPDWGSFFIGTEFSTLTRAIQDRWIGSFKNPWIGRNLFGMMKKAGIEDLSIEGHLLLTKGFEASDLAFDIAKTTEQLQAQGRAEGGLSAWLDDYKNTEAIAGVMLILCYGSKV